MKKKNSAIELYRFIFAMTVIFVHLPMFFTVENGLFGAAFFSMEFFFYVSGYFLGVSLDKNMNGKSFSERQMYVVKYFKNRVKRLFPMYIVALIVELAIRVLFEGVGFHGGIDLLKNCFAEFFMLQWTPLGKEVLISAMWFMPAVFFGSLLVIVVASFLCKDLKKFGLFVTPFIFLPVYAYLLVKVGKTDVIVSFYGVIRGAAGIAAGIFTYCLSKYVLKSSEREGNKLLFAIGNLILVAILVFENFAHRGPMNFVVIAIEAFAVMFVIGESIPIKNEKVEKVFVFLGSLSFPIYMFHVPVMHLIKLIIG